MNEINLYNIGKAFYQRAYRDPSNPLKVQAHNLSRDLWHSKKSKKDLLEIIALLKNIERNFSGIRIFYADIAERAVRSGNYIVSIPHEIAHRYNDRPGRVYILTSPSRPGQCKLGATTMNIVSRCIAYKNKYGYHVEDWFSIECNIPFTLEQQVAERIAHLRMAGNVKGDSIEWYGIEPVELKKLLIRVNREVIADRHNSGKNYVPEKA
jgi:hypothetical protein